MSASTIPEVKTVLLGLFKAAVEPATEVWAALPNEDHQNAENVYIEGARGQRQFVTIPATGPMSRQEDYQVQVTVEVWREGTDMEGTEARMWVIVAALEAAVAETPQIGGKGPKWGLAASFSQETLRTSNEGDNGFLARYAFGVEVTARI